MKRYRRGKNRCKVCGWMLDNGESHKHYLARLRTWVMGTLGIKEEKLLKKKKEPKKLPLFEGKDV